MKNGYKALCDVLLRDERFVDESGNLLKNKIQECALKTDEGLLKLLLNNEYTRNQFFVDIDGVKVFDKNRFSQFVESKNFLPDSYTRFTQNIILADEYGNSIKESSDVVLQFPNKDCVLEFDSTDENENRNEVFLNETLMKNEIDSLFAPKVFHNAVQHKKDSDCEATDISFEDNLVIKGNNLIAMHSLLPKYKGKIKLMYWDVLYNTNNDKVPYNDSFKHSSWLTMMKNRLSVAKDLLSKDGVLCIQCNDIEMAYLKVLCDEVFKRENYINTLCIEMSPSSGQKRSHKDKVFIKNMEYILVYTNGGTISIKPQYDEWQSYDNHYSIFFDGDKYSTLNAELKSKFSNYKHLSSKMYLLYDEVYSYIVDKSNCIFRTHDASKWALENVQKGERLYKDNNFEIVKVFNPTNSNQFELLKSKSNNSEFDRLEPLSWNVIGGKIQTLRGDFWADFDKDIGNVSKEGGVKLSNGKKPERLLMNLIDAFSNKNEIVLDAYLGTGTTAAVAMKMARRFIGIEQLDTHFQKSITRLTNVMNGDPTGISKEVDWQGGGSFISAELANNSQNYIDRISNTDVDEELVSIYEELKDSDFVLYRVDINKMEKNKGSFEDLSIDDKKKVLLSIIDKNTLYVNYSDLNNEDYEISDDDKAFTESFYKRGE